MLRSVGERGQIKIEGVPEARWEAFEVQLEGIHEGFVESTNADSVDVDIYEGNAEITGSLYKKESVFASWLKGSRYMSTLLLNSILPLQWRWVFS